MKTDELFSRPLRSLDELADLSASQLLVVSFVGLVTLGWLGFLFLPGLYEGAPMGWVDALFISASAVCVTGLSPIDVPNVLTFWGELWLVALIQAGALGILTFAAMVVAAAGRRSGLDIEEAAGGFASVLPRGTARQMLGTILGVTVAVEAMGALLLFALWVGEHGVAKSLWLAVFHSVSAFGNAGFSLFSDNLMGQREHPLVLLTFGWLIVMGGLGFPVVQDLRFRLRKRYRQRRLTTHTRLVLTATAVLVFGGALFFSFFEWNRELAQLGFVDRIANALLMSITPRTAGFNSVNYDGITNASLFLTFVLMWIGGAPASTAGGAKVTTATLLALVLWARLRGEAHVSVAGRTVPDETVNRATGLAVGMVLILMAFLTFMVAFEPAAADERAQLVRLAFEVQSALSTVGLSMNLTPALADGSKLTLVMAMLLGRVGPLAVLGAMALRSQRTSFRYAHEEVLIG